MVSKLHERHMWDDTLLIVLSDNGGPVYIPGSANNYPLKGGKYSDWEGGVRTLGVVGGGVVPAGLQGTTYSGLVSIADWYGIFCDLAGANWTDTAALKANEWLDRERPDLPQLHPVDSVRGLADAILSGNQTNLHPVLQLSDSALIRWPYKIVMGVQSFSNHTGPLYPNCSTLQSPSEPWHNDTKVFDHHIPWSHDTEELWRHLWAQDCVDGCLYDLSGDPNEHTDLSSDPYFADTLQELRDDLRDANAELFLPDRGSEAYEACDMTVSNGGFYGPFVAAQTYYTGPFPTPSHVQEAEEEAFKDLVAILSKPNVTSATLALARQLFPEYFRDPLEQSFDHCLPASLV